jgi:hypothetical protein
MARLKVYGIYEMRDYHLPTSMAKLLGASYHRQNPCWVTAYTKDDAARRLSALGTRHRAAHLRVVQADDDAVLGLLANAGDVVGYVGERDGDGIALIAAGETDARVVAHWRADPTDTVPAWDEWRRRRVVVPVSAEVPQ